MAVALDQTLIAKGIATMFKTGGQGQIEDAITNGTDIFIGALVTRYGETDPDIDLCGEDEMPWGIVLGYSFQETIDSAGYYYRDYDVPFADGKDVLVYIPVSGDELLVLGETNTTFEVGDPLKVVAGVVQVATTGDDIIAISLETKTAAANTRRYMYVRWR